MANLWDIQKAEQERKAAATHIVRWYFKSGAAGLYGWDSRSECYPTYEAARAAFESEAERPAAWNSVELIAWGAPDARGQRPQAKIATIRRQKKEAAK